MPDRWGQTVWPSNGVPYIELAHDAGPAQQRCTLCHEYQHLELGSDADEQQVREATARWLLPDLERVGSELGQYGVRIAADHLGITSKVLSDRLTTLTRHESAELAAFLKPATVSGQRMPRAVTTCTAGQEPGAHADPARSEADA